MIIVYGGTFNPPTIAHEMIVKNIITKFNPNHFLILPVGSSYTWKDKFASFNHRFNMLKLAFKDYDVEISNLEDSDNFKGTYHTLKVIKQKYNDEVYFLLGADNLNSLDKWISYSNLVKEFKFIVLTRGDFNLEELIKEKFNNYKDNFILFNFESEISASEFRKDLSKTNYINNDVLKYIKENNLYEVTKDEA